MSIVYHGTLSAGNIPTQENFNKPGKCPGISRQQGPCIPQTRCSYDKDCNADGKCCSDGCITSCVKPVDNINVQNGEFEVLSNG
jgi:hypothetical protein